MACVNCANAIKRQRQMRGRWWTDKGPTVIDGNILTKPHAVIRDIGGRGGGGRTRDMSYVGLRIANRTSSAGPGRAAASPFSFRPILLFHLSSGDTAYTSVCVSAILLFLGAAEQRWWYGTPGYHIPQRWRYVSRDATKIPLAATSGNNNRNVPLRIYRPEDGVISHISNKGLFNDIFVLQTINSTYLLLREKWKETSHNIRRAPSAPSLL